MKTAALLLCCLPAAALAAAQSAGDYFHGASYLYVAGRQQEAVIKADEGVRHYPQDEHLKMLDELLHRMQKQQRQDENQSGGGSQPPQNSPKQPNGKNQKPDQNPQNQQNQNQKQNGEKNPKQQPGQKQKSPQDSSGTKPPEAAHAGQADTGAGNENEKPKPGEMSKADAERLLNSFEDAEKQEQRQRLMPQHPRPEVEQDW